jgi:hypothetical protein
MAVNRKNALFAGHDEGGKACVRIASPIETAKIDGVEPFAYLKATLEAIAGGHPSPPSTTCRPGPASRQVETHRGLQTPLATTPAFCTSRPRAR